VDWARDGQAIILDSDRNGRMEIFRQGLNDSVAESLATSAEEISGETLSPDGKWVLYTEGVHHEPGAGPANDYLMRVPVMGGASETVMELPQGTPALVDYSFSCPLVADSSCVMSQREATTSSSAKGAKLANSPPLIKFDAFDPFKGKGEHLAQIEAAFFPQWALSPDGSRLAVVDMPLKGEIRMLSLTDKIWHKVRVESECSNFFAVAWAADGKGFLVTCKLNNSWRLLQVNLAGKTQLLFATGPGQEWLYSPRSSPDGKRLAIDIQTKGESNAFMIENF
jgi:Tol biopolymer transport system component